MESICKNLRVIREIKGLSQEYMSLKLHISQSAYAKLERGETRMTVQRLKEICSILEIDVPQLFRESHLLERLQGRSAPSVSPEVRLKANYMTHLDSLQDELLLLKEERKRLLRILEQLSRPPKSA
ncbi:MAG: helix-turn-helix transcriptional regulator [Flavobacteriales bacterium]|nr:helix-turn-helix transcriptional regulator [Flavobacteriales bacterium]